MHGSGSAAINRSANYQEAQYTQGSVAHHPALSPSCVLRHVHENLDGVAADASELRDLLEELSGLQDTVQCLEADVAGEQLPCQMMSFGTTR